VPALDGWSQREAASDDAVKAGPRRLPPRPRSALSCCSPLLRQGGSRRDHGDPSALCAPPRRACRRLGRGADPRERTPL